MKKTLKRLRQPGQSAYTVAGIGFEKKADIHKHAQAIHRALPLIGQVVEGPARDFMLGLFQHHHNWTGKQGAGVKAVVVGPDGYGGKLLRLRRVDGSEVDISWRQCIYGQTSQIGVLRHEIVGQILEARDAAFAGEVLLIRCPIDDVLVDRHGVDVDHAPPNTFAAIAKAWCAAEGIDIEDVEVAEDISGVDRLADRSLAMRWQAYHKLTATLRVISRQAHIRLTRGVSP
jgi:hypothetical protein